LGIILLVWLAVALIIKIFIRKPETWDDDEIEDDETEKYETEDEE